MRRSIQSASIAAVILFSASCFDQRPNSVTPTEPSFAKGGPKVKSITVSPSSATIAVSHTVQLTASASPKSAKPTYDWASSDEAVATVSTSGLVTGVAAGTASITASADGVSGASSITVSAAPPPGGAVLVGAGDIASCASSGDEETAALLDGVSGTVYTLGDNVYDNGTPTEFTNCYDPSWGRHKARTLPSPGNHDYNTPGATGYYGYYGSAAGDPTKGYYSYDLGDWHIIVLNSNNGSCTVVSCAAGSPQEQWLRADLAANSKTCTLAYWHHPRFNSGASHGNNTAVAPFWNALYDYGADVILNGHEHVYERFAPQTPAAVADAAGGIRQFTVGTGGRSHYTFGTIQPNSEVREANTYGVLKLTLRATGYDWQFIPVAGATFTDTGSGTCH